MSAKVKEYVDVTKQADGGYADVSKDAKPMSKQEEAEAESSRVREEEGPAPPAYTTPSAKPTETASSGQAQPISLVDDVSADVQSLAVGDPKETISVPMIHSVEKRNLKKLFSSERKTISQTVIVRKMPREHYLKHYAKDAEGNYVGTEKPAVDAGLVFVPSKSTPEDILQQVRTVAFGKNHYAMDFSGGMTMAPFLMGGSTGG